MRIVQEHNPNATLVEDRKGVLSISGSGNLIFSKNKNCITLDGVKSLSIKSFSFIQLHQETRVGRFLHAIKHLWRYCK